MYSNTEPKILAIDYDNTYTQHPEAFNQLAQAFKAIGWRVMIVTGRHSVDFDDIPKEVFTIFDDVVFCNGQAKCDVVKANIWIDDIPEVLLFSFRDGEFEVSERLSEFLENEHKYIEKLNQYYEKLVKCQNSKKELNEEV